MSLDSFPFMTVGLPMGDSLPTVMGKVPPILSDGGASLPPGNAAFWELERRALETFNRKRREVKMEERRQESVRNDHKEGCDSDDEVYPLYEDEPLLSCARSRRRRSDFKGRRCQRNTSNFVQSLLNLTQNPFELI